MRKRIMGLFTVFAVGILGLAGIGVATALRATTNNSVVDPHDSLIPETEQARKTADATTRNITLVAAPTTVLIGGRTVSTWAFNGQVPGPEIRAQVGDVVRAEVVNDLPEPLTVHWHGIAIRNDMDGVPQLNQEAIAPGARFVYEFVVSHEGSYFYHSHVGVQLDRGLYGPLTITSKSTTGPRDIPILLDDWTDGVGRTPDQQLAQLQSGSTGAGSPNSGQTGMSGMHHGSMIHGGMSGAANASQPLGADTVDIDYPMYLINGRSSADPAVIDAAPGEQVRLRLINAAASTPFRIAASGGAMTVVASDGYELHALPAKTFVIGMGERYDVLVRAPRTGSMFLVAQVEGKRASVSAMLRAPKVGSQSTMEPPADLTQDPVSLGDLHANPESSLPVRPAHQTFDVTLNGAMMGYEWGIAAPSVGGVSIPVREGQRIRMKVTNNTMMWHPVHLHGHTFQVVNLNHDGPRKDTIAIAPMDSITIEFDADNPGQWMLHCHNIYHAESGMITTFNSLK